MSQTETQLFQFLRRYGVNVENGAEAPTNYKPIDVFRSFEEVIDSHKRLQNHVLEDKSTGIMGTLSRLGSSTRTNLSKNFDIKDKSPVLVLRYPETMNQCFGKITEDKVFELYQFFTSNKHAYFSLYFSLINQVIGVDRVPYTDIEKPNFNILSPLLIFCFYTIDKRIEDSIKFNQKWEEYKDLNKNPEEEIRDLNYNRWGERGEKHLKHFFEQSGGKRRTKRNSKKAKKTRTRKHKRSQKKLRSRRR